MPNYEVDYSYTEYGSFIVPANNEADAKVIAEQEIKETFPGIENVEIINANEVTDL